MQRSMGRGDDSRGRETDSATRQLPRRQGQARLREGHQERASDLSETEVRRGLAGRREGRPRRQPREEATVRKVFALACLLILGTSVSAAAPTGSAPSFDRARSYRTGGVPLSLAIGDLNGDGKLDLLIANGYPSNTVTVLLNRGDGSFQPKRSYRTAANPDWVAIGDLNGDGKPDLAVANSYDPGSVSVLVNRGDG